MMKKAIIISGTKREYLVRYEDGTTDKVGVRKTLIYRSGPLYVGDYVFIDETKTIASLENRFNRLIRPRIANVSFGAVVTSVAEPKFSSYLLEKYLAYLLYSDVTPLILFTKIDKLDEKELAEIKGYHEYYLSLGFPSFLLTTKNPKTYADLIDYIHGKTVVFMGQTGAGKSSALNVIDPGLDRAIGEYSKALGRGKHQTKEIVLFPFHDGYIGDTPGFSSLELPFNEGELARCYPGFKRALECYFPDCLHQGEKLCVIKDELQKGTIRQESYENYVRMIKEIKENQR